MMIPYEVMDMQLAESKARLAAKDARIAELEKALRPFAMANGQAIAYVEVTGLPRMDRRDLFLWQVQRRLCVDDFSNASGAYYAHDFTA